MHRFTIPLVLGLGLLLAQAARGQCQVVASGCNALPLQPVCYSAPHVGNANFVVGVPATAGFNLIVFGLASATLQPTCGASPTCGTWIDVGKPVGVHVIQLHDAAQFLLPTGIPIPNIPALAGITFAVQSAPGLNGKCWWRDAMLVTIQ